MPKVLFINPAKNYGSTGKIVEQIGLLAESKGWKTCLVHAARYNRQSKLTCIKVGNVLIEKIHALMANLFDSQGLHSYFATRKAIRQIKKFSPDIIHLHNIHGYFLNYPLLFKYIAKYNIPVIWTMHDCWSFTGHCTYFDLVDCNKWKTGCHHCNNLNNYPQSVLLDRSKENYALKKAFFTSVNDITMVPVSKWLGDMTKQSFMGKYPIYVIHNGIDIDVFRLKENNLRQQLNLNGKYVVLGVSSNGFSGRKGLCDFIRLSNLLPDNYKIIMIGMTDRELKQIPKNIIGLKRTSNVEELVDYYNLADVFINPTYSDNFPTTNIEALACGTPVITYKTGGSPEAIDNSTGVVVKRGDITGMKNAIEMLCLETEKQKEHRRESARNRAIKLFNKNDRFNDYIKLYQSILNE